MSAGRVFALFTALALLLAACRDSEPRSSASPEPDASPTRGASRESPEETETTPEESPAAPTGLASPQLAAQHLHDSWQAGDRQAALRYASKPAVDELFESPYFPVDFVGCDAEAGGFACFYETEGEGIRMGVTGSEAAGYKVAEAAFISS